MKSNAHERYVIKPFAGSSHSWAGRHIDAVSTDARVLDVGPGSGIFGKRLKERGIEELYAVEIDEATRAHLAPFYKEIAEDISPFLSQKFDLILLLDVLEHMTDPFDFFKQVTELLAPGGIVLISLPNVAHWSVRFQLLFGQFNYTERGLLDRTHYQFFTRKRVRELIASGSAVSAVEYTSSIEPVELLLPKPLWDNSLFRFFAELRQKLAHVCPGMFAFQHLVKVRKN